MAWLYKRSANLCRIRLKKLLKQFSHVLVSYSGQPAFSQRFLCIETQVTNMIRGITRATTFLWKKILTVIGEQFLKGTICSQSGKTMGTDDYSTNLRLMSPPSMWSMRSLCWMAGQYGDNIDTRFTRIYVGPQLVLHYHINKFVKWTRCKPPLYIG